MTNGTNTGERRQIQEKTEPNILFCSPHCIGPLWHSDDGTLYYPCPDPESCQRIKVQSLFRQQLMLPIPSKQDGPPSAFRWPADDGPTFRGG